MSDRRTKAQLLAEMDVMRDRIDQLAEQRNEARAAVPPPVAPVPEGVAVGECIRALEAFKAAEGSASRSTGSQGISNSYGMNQPAVYFPTPVARVLRHLAEAYNVPLIEVQTRDCTRRHIDEIQQHEMWNAIQGALR